MDRWRIDSGEWRPDHNALSGLDHVRRAVKRPREVQVSFAEEARWIETLEGRVWVQPGDAVLTGSANEVWRVSAHKFDKKYSSIPPTTMGEAGRYLSLPIEVRAVSIDKPFTVLLTDGRSELHGHAGDWLIDYGDGSLGVVAARLFERIYRIED